MLNTININLKTDIKTDRPATLPIKLMSQDKNNNQFILRFTNGGESVTLDDSYTVEVLTKFTKSGTSRLTTAKVRQDYATWEFDTAYITQDETVYNYVYVRKSGNLVVSADANCFVFSVDLSEIDKGAGKVAETYDENYQKHLDEFKDNVDFEEIAQAEQARKEAEILRQESYDTKVDTAIVEADVVGKVDSKVLELTPQINNLTAQLAQTELLTSSVKASDKNVTGAVVTFVLDNGQKVFNSPGNWKELADDKDFKVSLAIITSLLDVNTNYLTTSELLTIQADGHDILSHSHTHPNSWSTLSQAEIDYECKTSQDILKQKGFKGANVLVYSSSGNPLNFALKNGVRRYYDYAVSVYQAGLPYHNNTPVDNWCMTRADGENMTLAQMSSALDEAIKKGGWLIFYAHPENMTAEMYQKLSDFIDYTKNKNVPILPFLEAEKAKGNAVAQGDIRQDGNKAFISHDGKSIIESSNGMVEISSSTAVDRLLPSYKKGAITIERMIGSVDVVLGTGGTRTTYNNFDVDAYAYQTFVPYGRNELYMRKWNGAAGSWGRFEGMTQSFVKQKDQGAILSALPSYFPPDTESTYPVVANANSPTGSAGVYKIYNFSDAIYTYAEFKQWSTNEAYRRRWDNTNGVWMAWEKVSTI